MQIQGWHGGSRWDGPAAIQAPRANRYEHGCGIYLTNVWRRAADYAKGGRVVMRITLELDALDPHPVPIEEVDHFVRTCPGLRRRKEILSYLKERRHEQFMPEYLNNLCVNERALTSISAPRVARWLTEHGMPLGTSYIGTNGGVREEWAVIFDPSIVKAVEVVPRSEIDKLPSYGDRNVPAFSEQIRLQAEAAPSPTLPA